MRTPGSPVWRMRGRSCPGPRRWESRRSGSGGVRWPGLRVPAARLDDVLNYIPARFTGVVTVAAAPVVGGSSLGALRVLRRDGARHPSPNAGRCEASAAGALGVRLGGTNTYGDVVEHRPVMGS